VPDPLVQKKRARRLLSGDPPDPADAPSGCPFRSRCPDAIDLCAQQVPPPVPVEGGGWAACHLVPSAAGSSPAALTVP
jgi:oligopeptide/dipeptide ABC transporter ATP-binding protein